MHITKTDRPIHWRQWARTFELRADRPLPDLDRDHDYRLLPGSVKRSLAVFQLGESGGGRIVEEARASNVPGLGRHYAHALECFVAEEHRHANILAICVRLTGGRLLKDNWTDRLFVLGRRLMGLRLKVLVLLAAEVVGLCFYRAIALRLPPGNLKTSLLEIAADERDHLEFHTDFFRNQLGSPFKSMIFNVVWRTLIGVTAIVVFLDHRRTLRDLDIPAGQAWRRLQRWCRRVECGLQSTGRQSDASGTLAVFRTGV